MLRDRKNRIRLILFILAAGLAVFSFTYGVKQFGHRDPGWQDIEPDIRSGDVVYGSGLTLRCYAAGSSADIRDLTEAVKNVYTDSLTKNIKLLDARNVYEDTVNLASLNQQAGRAVVISDRLYRVLRKALELSAENRGYSLTAGWLWGEWQTLLYLEEPQEFDPLNSAEEASRMSRLTGLVSLPGSAVLELRETDSGAEACLRLSPEAQQAAEELEITAPVCDLAQMHDGFLMDLISEDLCAAGFTDWVLYSRTGLSLIPGSSRTLTVFPEGDDRAEARLTVSGPAVTARFSASAPVADGYGAYTVGSFRRHYWFDARTGGFRNLVDSAVLAGSGLTAAEAAWQLICLNCAEDPSSLSLPAGMRALWTRQGDPAHTVQRLP